MIDGMTIRWRCDHCGYRKRAGYGAEPTNVPTVRCLPAGWRHAKPWESDGVPETLVEPGDADEATMVICDYCAPAGGAA